MSGSAADILSRKLDAVLAGQAEAAARLDGVARPVRISMRNVFGRDVQEVGTRTRLAWSPGSLVLFR